MAGSVLTNGTDCWYQYRVGYTSYDGDATTWLNIKTHHRVHMPALSVKNVVIRGIRVMLSSREDGVAGVRKIGVAFSNTKFEDPNEAEELMEFSSINLSATATYFSLNTPSSVDTTKTWYIYLYQSEGEQFYGEWNMEIRVYYQNAIAYGKSGKWVKCIPYYGYNGAWKQCEPYYGSSGEWKSCSGG